MMYILLTKYDCMCELIVSQDYRLFFISFLKIILFSYRALNVNVIFFLNHPVH